MDPGYPYVQATTMATGKIFPMLLATALFAAGCASTETYDPEAALAGLSGEDPDWSWAALGPNDVVRVIVYGHDEASTRAEGERIDLTGVVTLPLIGPVEIGGLKLDEARDELVRLYSPFIREPKVAVTVLQYGAREFFLLGHVETPGPYTLNRPLAALQALSHGGNLLRGAERESVLLFRRLPERYDVYSFDATRPGPDGMIPVEPNDLIFVARSDSGRFYEDVLPYLQGAGFLAAVPVGIATVVK